MDASKPNHVRISELLSFMYPNGYITLPRIDLSKERYSIEEFDRSRPLWNEDVWSSLSNGEKKIHLSMVKEFICSMTKYDYYLRDVEMYLQTNGNLIMSNLSRVHHEKSGNGLTIESATILPTSVISKGFFN